MDDVRLDKKNLLMCWHYRQKLIKKFHFTKKIVQIKSYHLKFIIQALYQNIFEEYSIHSDLFGSKSLFEHKKMFFKI
jgi:hypothetical protein